MPGYIGAMDQGTTSTRFIVYDHKARVVGMDQKEHRQIQPKPGWVEHDPLEILDNAYEVIRGALAKAGIRGRDLAGVGVTNQRETVAVWDRRSGRPFANAVVWQCARTRDICDRLIEEGGVDRFRPTAGLPVSTYFSGPKIRWILDTFPEARRAAEKGDALYGTMETWLIWWLTGGPQGGAHVSDVTNASRTLLLNIHTLQWEQEHLDILDIPRSGLPRVVPSSDEDSWGPTSEDGPFGARVPVCGALGDQQAALVGQACFRPGEAKNTYGTGCFLLLNTGAEPVTSKHGLLTTPAYQFSGEKPAYCLEGSIANAGSLIRWLRDNLGLIRTTAEVEDLAGEVEDNGGVYIVPAFSGLLAPYWRPDARGGITGLTGYATKHHLARAALEAAAYQTRDVAEAMNRDSGVMLRELRVDGGMTANELLMQFQADILDVPVSRPGTIETTCLGAAYAAAIASGFWSTGENPVSNWRTDTTWHPSMEAEGREAAYREWKKAVQRSLDWVE